MIPGISGHSSFYFPIIAMSLLTGYRDRRIAEIREISENTVAAYRHRILPNRDAYFLRAFSYRVFAAVSTLE